MLLIVCRFISSTSLLFKFMDLGKYIESLGEALRHRRAKIGYSQESFADAVGLHRTYIGAVERGERNITVKNLAKIADALDITPSLLLKDAEKNLK